MSRDLTLRLVGTAPLLMRAGRLADPLDPFAVSLARITAKRLKVVADHEAIARIEFLGGLWLADGRPCIPAEALESCLVASAKTRRAGSLVRGAVTVRDSPLLEYAGPGDLDELYRSDAFRHRCGVRINGRTTMRTRPRFGDWSVVATFSYLPTLIDEATLREIACVAGDIVGIGDWRPRFGRFRVEDAAA